ncbi:MAG: flagellar hook-basal body complex protein [Puniceicoccaceae bacterium]|nr:MAG: flagellar hook-basal body complex protein [Puniceicoccaceae bacterium]
MSVFGSLNSGISALRSFSKGMEVIGNNIANVNTISFKGSRIQYTDTFSQVLQQSSPSPQDGLGSNVTASQVGLGVEISTVRGLFHQGGLTATNQRTDLAISGEGFFQVVDTRNNNMAFATRAGDFRVDDRGFLVTNDGLRVQGMFDGAIAFQVHRDGEGNISFTKDNSASGTIVPSKIGDLKIDYPKDEASTIVGPYDPANDPSRPPLYFTSLTGGITEEEARLAAPDLVNYSISPEGEIIFFLSNGDSFTRGQVMLMDFHDSSALIREGRNLYSGFGAAGVKSISPDGQPGLATPGRTGLGRINQNALELSNVDLTEEFANMIVTQRGFQAGSRIITVSDDILQEVVNLKR